MEVIYGIGNYYCSQPSCVTVGTFDGLHIGHRKILDRLIEISAAQGLRSVVVTFDPHPRQVLAPDRPVSFVLTQQEKIDAFRMAGIDCLVVHPFSHDFARMSAKEFLENMLCNALNMKHLVKGFNNHFGCDRLSDLGQISAIGEGAGFAVTKVEAESADGIQASSTLLRDLVRKGDMLMAREILGRCFPLSGNVVHGRMIGRSIDFPTANISVDDPCKIIPAAGAYSCVAHADGRWWPAMLNIGSNPTVNGDSAKLLLEAHLVGYQGNLYDKCLSLKLISRLRDEQRFPSLDALRYQLINDKTDALAICRREFPRIAEGSLDL